MTKSGVGKPNITFKNGMVETRGYGQVPTSVLEDGSLSRDAKALYTYLLCKTGASNFCYPSNETIMEALSIKTKNSLREYKNQLIDKQLLKVVERKFKSGRTTSNYYYPTKMLMENSKDKS